MQMRNKTPRYLSAMLIALALSIAALPAVSQADTISIRREFYGAGRNMEIWSAGEHFNTHTGVRMLKKNGGTGDGNLWENGLMAAFCIQLTENTSTNYKTYNVIQVKDANEPLYDGTKLGAEPATMGLLAVGGIGFLTRRRKTA